MTNRQYPSPTAGEPEGSAYQAPREPDRNDDQSGAQSFDRAVEGEVRNEDRYPSRSRSGSGTGSYSPTTSGAKAEHTARDGAGPSLKILIGIAVLLGIALIIALFLFAGDPFGVQSFFSPLQTPVA